MLDPGWQSSNVDENAEVDGNVGAVIVEEDSSDAVDKQAAASNGLMVDAESSVPVAVLNVPKVSVERASSTASSSTFWYMASALSGRVSCGSEAASSSSMRRSTISEMERT